jgi:Uma2 family endonuclease
VNRVIKPHQSRYTVADYMSWPDSERWELIEGYAFNMSPAPTIRHQSIAGNFYSQLKQRLTGKPCIALIAPVDVVLSAEDIVQPDVLVVCDSHKVTEKNIQGAPDLVIEVLSPSTAVKDMREKKALYQRTGVREYIVIEPQENYVQRFFLTDEGIYGASDIFGAQEHLPLLSLPEIVVPLWEVFDVELLEDEDTKR